MAGSARDIQMRELKDTISELNKLIKTLQQTIEAANAREAALCQERDNLKEQMDYLTKRLFGASSEKANAIFLGSWICLMKQKQQKIQWPPSQKKLFPPGKNQKQSPERSALPTKNA